MKKLIASLFIAASLLVGVNGHVAAQDEGTGVTVASVCVTEADAREVLRLALSDQDAANTYWISNCIRFPSPLPAAIVERGDLYKTVAGDYYLLKVVNVFSGEIAWTWIERGLYEKITKDETI